MPATIVFNDDREGASSQLKVAEDPESLAEALENSSVLKVTVRGAPVWVNASSVRMLREQGQGGRRGKGTAGAKGKKSARVPRSRTP